MEKFVIPGLGCGCGSTGPALRKWFLGGCVQGQDWDLYCLSRPGYMGKQAAIIISCMMCLGKKSPSEISISPTHVSLSI